MLQRKKNCDQLGMHSAGKWHPGWLLATHDLASALKRALGGRDKLGSLEGKSRDSPWQATPSSGSEPGTKTQAALAAAQAREAPLGRSCWGGGL